mmetsp:Transcript_14401/g.26536  ORF Transcript_14401/g.26536 Transcript_14401/m.26536 type:complete len:196 (+) Transcript_14401:527-1114(+)
MGSPEIHENSWGKDVISNPGQMRDFQYGDLVLVRFGGQNFSDAMRMMVIINDWGMSFQELNEDDEPMQLTPGLLPNDPDNWVRNSGELLLHTPQATSNSAMQRTIICGVIKREGEYDGDSNSRLGLFVGASRKSSTGAPTNTIVNIRANSNELANSLEVQGQMALGECGNTGEQIFKRIAEIVKYMGCAWEDDNY